MRWGAALLLTFVALAAGATTECPDLDFEDFDTAPELVDVVTPRFPEMAILSRMSGEVVVSAQLQADGTVCDIELVKSVHPMLDREAITAARKSRFQPATRDGEAVPGSMELRYVFHNAPTSADELDDAGRKLIGEPPLIYATTVEYHNFFYFSPHRWIWCSPVLEFRGDISLEKYRKVVADLDEFLENGETLLVIETRLLRQSVNGLVLRNDLKVEVRVCEKRRNNGSCTNERMFVFRGEDLKLRN